MVVPRKHRVLCIEDNHSHLLLVDRLLAELPEVELLAAYSGREGLELAQSRLPHLILLDSRLPDINGLEVLDRLKAHQTTRHIPVIVISADANRQQIDRFLIAGAHSYLTKPFDVEEFFRIIEEAKE